MADNYYTTLIVKFLYKDLPNDWFDNLKFYVFFKLITFKIKVVAIHL